MMGVCIFTCITLTILRVQPAKCFPIFQTQETDIQRSQVTPHRGGTGTSPSSPSRPYPCPSWLLSGNKAQPQKVCQQELHSGDQFSLLRATNRGGGVGAPGLCGWSQPSLALQLPGPPPTAQPVPINDDGVRGRLIPVATALPVTAPAERWGGREGERGWRTGKLQGVVCVWGGAPGWGCWWRVSEYGISGIPGPEGLTPRRLGEKGSWGSYMRTCRDQPWE